MLRCKLCAKMLKDLLVKGLHRASFLEEGDPPEQDSCNTSGVYSMSKCVS